jgi:hypothetical protein
MDLKIFASDCNNPVRPTVAADGPALASLDLRELSERVREKHAATRNAARVTLREAMDAGDALIEGRNRMTDSDWKKWVRDSCGVAIRTAQLYEQLSRGRPLIEAAIRDKPDLSICGARRLITVKRVRASKEEPESDSSFTPESKGFPTPETPSTNAPVEGATNALPKPVDPVAGDPEASAAEIRAGFAAIEAGAEAENMKAKFAAIETAATPKTTKRNISQRELEAAQAHAAELEAAREHDRNLAEQLRVAEIRISKFEDEIAELKDGKALKAEVNKLRAALERVSKLLGEARALAVHLSHNRDAVLGKMQSAKTAADTALAETAIGKTDGAMQPSRKPEVLGARDQISLSDAVINAFDYLEELAGECRETVDSAPPGISETQRIQTLDDTAGILEDLSVPDVSAELAQIKINPPKHRRPRTRGDRRDAVLGMLAACMGALDAIDKNDPRHHKALDLYSKLECASSEVEGCEFPGMYR